jgi:hypothetical protein
MSRLRLGMAVLLRKTQNGIVATTIVTQWNSVE